MNIIEPTNQEGFPLLEIGDILIYDSKTYILIQHGSEFMFTNIYGGGYNGRHNSLTEITNRTSDDIEYGDAVKLYRSSEYSLQLVRK